MPGGGFGLFDGCSKEWKATSSVWGAQYGGSNTNTCSQFPPALQKGCGFRWDWMQGQSNPTVNYEQVTCPAELVAKSGCSVSGYQAPSSNYSQVSTRSPIEESSTTTTESSGQSTGVSEGGYPTGTTTAAGVEETGVVGAGGEEEEEDDTCEP
ncbi:MAG: hypothetical protein LQ343_007638 [Gyalolechia ehrenbergii]|nr:MAG: hypothetical protein LQ343_007638 [Gyalolechia ehrenbergii]